MVQSKFDEKSIDFTFEKINIIWTTMLLDEQRVKQIFMNLLTNAAKFTPVGGKVDFVMELISETETLIVDRFIIRDNGIGMSEEFLPKLFEPFVQENRVNEDNGGTGLGLPIVKSLVELMDGSISVKSEVSVGTEFIVYLHFPLARGATPVNNQIGLTGTMPAGLSILLCEDQSLNALIATRLLQAKGAHITLAKNGRQALDLFSQSAKGEYDIILMDIQMPIMNGLEATRAIRGLTREDAKRIPIIAMTANAYEEDKENALKAGMNAHVAKPIDPKVIYQTISEWVGAGQS